MSFKGIVWSSTAASALPVVATPVITAADAAIVLLRNERLSMVSSVLVGGFAS
jgi:hypothetical protein